MSDLPKGWIKTILFEIYDFSIGGDWGKDSKPNEKEYVEVKVVRGTDFKDWFRNKGRNAAQRFIKKSSLLKRNLKSGDIVVEVSGGGPTQPVGRSIIIDDSTLNIQKMPVVPSNFFRLLRLSSFVNPFFFNYYINFSNKIGLLDKYQTQTTNLRNLQYTDFLGNFEVPFPPLKEQKRIVEKLDKLLAKVEAAKERLDKIPGILKKYRQSVLHASVTGELTKEWREENNFTDNIDTIIKQINERRLASAKSKKDKVKINNIYKTAEKNIFELPDEWSFKFLDKLAYSFNYGTSKKSNKEGKVPVLRMGNLQDGKINWSNLVYTDDENEIIKFLLKPNTVLFNRTNSPELVGKTSIYKGERKAIFAGYLIRINNVFELLPKLRICKKIL